MPTLTYNGPHASVYVVALGVDVERGHEVDVDNDELAAQLLEQDFVTSDQETTVKAVKARVGDDPELARIELANELARTSPRSSLVKHLETVAEPLELEPVLDTDPPPPAEEPIVADTVTDPQTEV